MKKHKKLKGMTLIEVLVSLAIFTIMCSGMVMCASAVNQTVTANIYFNHKMNDQTATIDLKTPTSNTSTSNFSVSCSMGSASITVTRFEGDETAECNNGINFSFFQK